MRYLHLDVFTSTPFSGNQLAVFPNPGDVRAETMQAIAKEMAFSETTFIFPPEHGGDVRMRIFTPGEELPMAGHPTIGTTFALAMEGTIARGRERWIFELGVGPTPVSLEWDDHGLDHRSCGACLGNRPRGAGATRKSSRADRLVRRPLPLCAGGDAGGSGRGDDRPAGVA